jgi:hypothetical protein
VGRGGGSRAGAPEGLRTNQTHTAYLAHGFYLDDLIMY